MIGILGSFLVCFAAVTAQNCNMQMRNCFQADLTNAQQCLRAFQSRKQQPFSSPCEQEFHDLEMDEMLLDIAVKLQNVQCVTSNAQGCPSQTNSNYDNYDGEDDRYDEDDDFNENFTGDEAWLNACKPWFNMNSQCWKAVPEQCTALEERCDDCVVVKPLSGVQFESNRMRQAQFRLRTFDDAYDKLETEYEALERSAGCANEFEDDDGPGGDYGAFNYGNAGKGNARTQSPWGQPWGNGKRRRRSARK